MVSPYAAGLGGFMNGFAGGMKIGKDLREQYDQHQAQKEREAAIAEARQQYQQQVQQQADAIEGLQQPAPTQEAPADGQPGAVATPVQQRSVEAQGIPALDGSTPPDAARPMQPAAMGLGGGQQTADKVIETPTADPKAMAATRQQSVQIAKQQAGGERDAIDKAISSRMRNFYMDRGDVAMAEQWDKYAEGQQGRRQIKAFSGALQAYSVGNMQGFVENMIPILKDAYGEGFNLQKYEPVKTKDGEVTGYNFTIRNTRTGEVTQNSVPIDQLVQQGMALGSPEAIHKRFVDAEVAKAKAKADAAAKKGEIDARSNAAIREENNRQGGRVQIKEIENKNQAQRDDRLHEQRLERDVQKGKIDSQNQRNKVQQELDAKVGALQKAGYSDDFIKNALPDILGVNQYKKTTSPEEAKRLAFSDRMKNDPSFGRKSPEQQRQIIENDMSLIYAGAQPSAVAPSSSQPPANPAAKGLPVLDKKTGQIVYR